MRKFPESWATAVVSEVATFVRGVTYTKSDARDAAGSDLVGILRANNISDSRLDLTDLVFVPRRLVAEEQLLKLGDVVVATSSGSASVVGKAAQVRTPMDLSFGAFCAVLRPIDEMEPRYFGHYFQTQQYRSSASAVARGVNINNLKRSHFDTFRIAFPSRVEQARIADKLDAVLARIDACRARLDRVPAILKRFREAVLEAAVSGRLADEWGTAGRQSPDTRAFSGSDADPFRGYQFPVTWQATRLSEIAEVIGGLTKDSKKQSQADEELPYLRVANVQRGFLNLTEMKTIRVPSQKVDDLLLRSGDILFNEGGDIDKLGRGWVWEGQIKRCVFQNHVFRARLRDKAFAPKFFSYYANSRGFDYFLARGKQTTNLASINKSVLSSLPVPVPSADEQWQIVGRINELFALADGLEAKYRAAVERVEKLTPAMLGKAFRGELVPQDPKDEPASVLLERIKKQRDATGTTVVRDRTRAEESASMKQPARKVRVTRSGRA